MAKTMIASGMTDGQIDNVVNKLRDALRKHRDEFGADPAQQVIGRENLGMELLAPFRALVEAESEFIVRPASRLRNSPMYQRPLAVSPVTSSMTPEYTCM